MTSETESYLREQIVTDHVSLMLPVKSLLRFKCVCKSWRDLFKSSDFIKRHFDNESIRPRLQVGKFGVDYKHEEPIRSFNFFVLPEKIFAGCIPAQKRTFRIEGVTDFRDIHGPIDGIFLLEKGHFIDNPRFAWWNPATKECRLIPKVTFDDLLETFQDCCRLVGIGMDLVNQDYKVVWFRTFWDEMTTDLFPKIFAALYSSKDDSWKYLEPNFSYECQVSVPLGDTYLNGRSHWMTSSKVICDKDNVFSILTFDFATELFGKLEGPPIPGDCWATIMLRGGSIASMSSQNSAQPMVACYDIWVMIREKTWIKIFVVNPPIPWHWPVGIWDYDKFIFELTETLRMVFYCQTAKEATNLGFDFFRELDSGFCWSTHYKESLVSVKRENPTEEDNVEYFFTKF